MTAAGGDVRVFSLLVGLEGGNDSVENVTDLLDIVLISGNQPAGIIVGVADDEDIDGLVVGDLLGGVEVRHSSLIDETGIRGRTW